MLQTCSNWLSRQESRAACLLASSIALLIVFNVCTRAMDRAVYWVDEAAIILMVWMLFLSMAVLLKQRQAVAVTVLVDTLPKRLRCAIGAFIDWMVLLFAMLLLVFCWRWYQPLELLHHGLDFDAFSAHTMNFIYQERANTLPMPKFWAWLIVPYFACSTLLHTLAHILSDPTGRHMHPILQQQPTVEPRNTAAHHLQGGKHP